MQDKIYIHYGHKEFDYNLFEQIENEPCWIKPRGGLWASPIDAKRGWKDWCEDEEFRECTADNSFSFTLPGANIFLIDSIKALNELPMIKNELFKSISKLIDFEACIKLGYDALELNLSADPQLYWELYGWDCDSIIVMNPYRIKLIKDIEWQTKNHTQVTKPRDIFYTEVDKDSQKKHRLL